ncbi:MAG: NAD-dependent epimerase/dehydratase family protein, partial [Candidatus Fonsibacter sp.]
MNILVTGGAGFIGSHLVDQLIALGNKVKILDNISSGNLLYVNSKSELIQGS